MAEDHIAHGRQGGVEVTGVVVEVLPSAMYRVELDDHRPVLAHATRDARRNFVRVLVGDRVVVELSPVDRSRGRIARRLS
ncbi:MAG: translation initiation factor IF-1 [Acidobacteria bacterium RBG_16_68_9]|nr:MAG: translation initiation factor IF-1 [Acidobacteria bacterium RBG_16_68_9]